MADEIYVGQPLTIVFDTNVDLSNASAFKGLYRKPDGTVGEVSGTDSDTLIIVTYAYTIMNQTGPWDFQSSVILEGDTVPTLGRTAHLPIRPKWTP